MSGGAATPPSPSSRGGGGDDEATAAAGARSNGGGGGGGLGASLHRGLAGAKRALARALLGFALVSDVDARRLDDAISGGGGGSRRRTGGRTGGGGSSSRARSRGGGGGGGGGGVFDDDGSDDGDWEDGDAATASAGLESDDDGEYYEDAEDGDNGDGGEEEYEDGGDGGAGELPSGLRRYATLKRLTSDDEWATVVGAPSSRRRGELAVFAVLLSDACEGAAGLLSCSCAAAAMPVLRSRRRSSQAD